MKQTVYETITNQIVAAIEAGAADYRMPWHRSRFDVASPSNALTGHRYRGVNVLALWMLAEARGFDSGQWATYAQWQAAGAQVKRGETSATIVFFKELAGATTDEGAGDEPQRRLLARAYHVFNADQVEGYDMPAVPVLPESERIATAEALFTAIPATVEHGGNRACYNPAADRVQLPPFGQFRRPQDYYGTLAHELTHWTGAKARLDRELATRFGSEAYAMEELVAELGAAFTVGQLGLPSVPRDDHAPYIANWLRVLKNDSRAIFTAASKAQAAADYLASYAGHAAG